MKQYFNSQRLSVHAGINPYTLLDLLFLFSVETKPSKFQFTNLIASHRVRLLWSWLVQIIYFWLYGAIWTCQLWRIKALSREELIFGANQPSAWTTKYNFVFKIFIIVSFFLFHFSCIRTEVQENNLNNCIVYRNIVTKKKGNL
jgi:hypothetical protein